MFLKKGYHLLLACLSISQPKDYDRYSFLLLTFIHFASFLMELSSLDNLRPYHIQQVIQLGRLYPRSFYSLVFSIH